MVTPVVKIIATLLGIGTAATQIFLTIFTIWFIVRLMKFTLSDNWKFQTPKIYSTLFITARRFDQRLFALR